MPPELSALAQQEPEKVLFPLAHRASSFWPIVNINPIPADLYEAAAAAKTPSSGAIFLPYLSGERTPHNDPNAKGAFFGLTHEDNSVTMAQAALEGVAFALADGIEVLEKKNPSIKSLSVIGGGIEDICTPPPISHTIEPNADLRDLYAERRQSFKQLYQATKHLNKASL